MSTETIEMIHNTVPLATAPFVIAFPMWYASRYALDRAAAVKYSVTLSLVMMIFGYCCRWAGDLLGIPVSLNSARTFLFIPAFLWALGRIWKIDIWQGADFTTPMCFISRSIILIGCTLLGCGNAVACDWGIYNASYEYRVFPLDLLDMAATFVIGIVSLVYARRLRYKGNGRVFALAMICLGVARHLIQLGSTERYFGIRGINEDAIISVISVFIGVLIFQRNESRVNITKK